MTSVWIQWTNRSAVTLCRLDDLSWLPNQAVQALAEAAGHQLGVAQALWQVGCALSDQCCWHEAEMPLHRSLALLEAEQHCDHMDLARVCNGGKAQYYAAGPFELAS